MKLSRRDFVQTAGVAAATVSAGLATLHSWARPAKAASPIVVFSKVYQALKLTFAQAAEVTAEAGIDGVDCPVRPGGEILPENAAKDLPRYVEALRSRGLTMPLLTTAITGVESPHTEDILQAAKAAGVQYYRLGFIPRNGDLPEQIKSVREKLIPLAALNKKIGIGALIQNHSPAGKSFLGGDLAEMEAVLEGFDPAQIGLAFDIGHAWVVHGPQWRTHFDKLKPYFKIAYVKDVKPGPQWVRFGEGDLAGTGYFRLLRELNYHAPVSLHIEFDWMEEGKAKDRAHLVSAIKESAAVLRSWLAKG